MGIWLSEAVVKRFVWWGCYDVVYIFSGLCSFTSELVSLATVFVSSHKALRDETKTATR